MQSVALKLDLEGRGRRCIDGWEASGTFRQQDNESKRGEEEKVHVCSGKVH